MRGYGKTRSASMQHSMVTQPSINSAGSCLNPVIAEITHRPRYSSLPVPFLLGCKNLHVFTAFSLIQNNPQSDGLMGQRLFIVVILLMPLSSNDFLESVLI